MNSNPYQVGRIVVWLANKDKLTREDQYREVNGVKWKYDIPEGAKARITESSYYNLKPSDPWLNIKWLEHPTADYIDGGYHKSSFKFATPEDPFEKDGVE